MCNRYATYGETNALQGALTSLELDWADETPLRPADIYPDQDAQIVRQIGDELALVEARWGFPEIKKGAGVITNIRNLASPWWQRVNRRYLLEPEYRCLVPFDRFAEPPRAPTWFSMSKPAFFAGVWRPFQGERLMAVAGKARRQRVLNDWHLFSFLTCDANAEVRPVHPKAMPVILSDPADLRDWLAGGVDSLYRLQRPLPDYSLQVN